MSEIAAADTPPPPPPPEPPKLPETRELGTPHTGDTEPYHGDDFDPMADLTPVDTAPPVEADKIDDQGGSGPDSELAGQRIELDPMANLEPANPETPTEPGDIEPAEPGVDERADDQANGAPAGTGRPVEQDALRQHGGELDGQPDEVDHVDPVRDPPPDREPSSADEPTATERETPAEHPLGTDQDVYDPLSQVDPLHEEQPNGPGEDPPVAPPSDVPATDSPVAAEVRAEQENLDQTLTEDQTTVDEAAAEGPDTPAAGTTDDTVARYGYDDLDSTGNRSSIHATELMVGPDGLDHYPGDRVGTFRDSHGGLHDSETGRYAKDDNPQPTASMQRRADPDLDNSRTYSARAEGESSSAELPESAQDLQDRASERQEIIERRAEIWNDLQPLAAKLSQATSQTTGPNDFHTDRFNDLRDQADLYLTRTERVEFANLGKAYMESGNELNRASERLGAAGGAFARGQEFPDCQQVTGGDDVRGSAGNLDTIAYLDSDPPTLLAFEEKGAGGKLGSRIVVDPASADGDHVRAEQGSPEYLRHMLEHDNKLTEAVHADPVLTAKLQAAVDSGNVRYLLVHTAPDGTVTVTDFRLDPSRIHLDNLRILRIRGTDDR